MLQFGNNNVLAGLDMGAENVRNQVNRFGSATCEDYLGALLCIDKGAN